MYQGWVGSTWVPHPMRLIPLPKAKERLMLKYWNMHDFPPPEERLQMVP